MADGYSDAIDRNGGLNQIQVEAISYTLRFFINNELIADIQDADYISGDIELASYRLPGVTREIEAYFDNLIIAEYPFSTVHFSKSGVATANKRILAQISDEVSG